MPYNPEKHHRRSIRLPGYDYTRPGAYYVTLRVNIYDLPMCTIVHEAVRLSDVGRIVVRSWAWLGDHYPYVELDAWVVMPDHLHGILMILGDEAVAVPGVKRKPLGQLIGAFKTVSTKEINRLLDTPGARFWQRNYYEHIVRDEKDLNRIRRYIAANPRRWRKRRGCG